jgi:hypothetical protein
MAVPLHLRVVRAYIGGAPAWPSPRQLCHRRSGSRVNVARRVIATSGKWESGPAREGATSAVLALDVGTTAMKGALVLPSGELLARSSAAYEHGTQTGSGK